MSIRRDSGCWKLASRSHAEETLGNNYLLQLQLQCNYLLQLLALVLLSASWLLHLHWEGNTAY